MDVFAGFHGRVLAAVQQLKHDGVVELHNRMIHIVDWDRLTRIGDFDPDYLHLAGPGGSAVNRMAMA